MKIYTSAIIKEYEANQENYKTLLEEVQYQLSKLPSEQKVKIHSIPHRIKNIDSLITKIRKKKIARPFDQIHDLVGFRVICLFLSDIEKIGKAIEAKFNVFDKDDKINEEESKVFGYMSLHLKAKLKQPLREEIDQKIANIPFEIQVRTIAQDAWASISHYLDYKTNNISKDFERDFYALSGLFYIADTHFSLIKEEQPKNIKA